MKESTREDLYLFYNDLYEYQKSREGQQVARTHKRHQNGKATETEPETTFDQVKATTSKRTKFGRYVCNITTSHTKTK